MELRDSQKAALHRVNKDSERICKLNGAAGTGKTTCIQHINGAEVVTPTNKSAQVLRQKGVEANTLYSRFFTLVDEDGVPIPPNHRRAIGGKQKLRFLSNKKVLASGYGLAEGKIASAGTVVLDEASMAHGSMINDISDMCNKLILVGDDCQLPPVKDRTYPKGLFNQMRPTASLTEILRQDAGSDILKLATAMREYPYSAAIGLANAHNVFHYATEHTFANPERVYLLHSNAGRTMVNKYIRRMTGRTSHAPEVGEPILFRENYGDGFYNGTMATVRRVEELKIRDMRVAWFLLLENEVGELLGAVIHSRTLYHVKEYIYAAPMEADEEYINYDSLKQNAGEVVDSTLEDQALHNYTSAPTVLFPWVQFGYAITVHSAQGSEWDDVAVIGAHSNLPKSMGGDEDGAKRWFYTAVTRAKENLIVTYNYKLSEFVEENNEEFA